MKSWPLTPESDLEVSASSIKLSNFVQYKFLNGSCPKLHKYLHAASFILPSLDIMTHAGRSAVKILVDAASRRPLAFAPLRQFGVSKKRTIRQSTHPLRAFSSSLRVHEKQRLGNSDASTQAGGDLWMEWSQNPEYRNAWSNDIEPLNADPLLDRQSRFLLDLLNKLYQVGLTKTVDRVTTPRIHAMIKKLEAIPDQSIESMWQRAERARVLLEAMELFHDFRDETKLPIALPLPNHETYWRVLRMYGSKYLRGNLQQDAPAVSRDIVQRMERSNRLELQPTAIHWNQVLSAYANSLDGARPFKAAQLVYELNDKGLADGSSFSHALRACVSMSTRQQSTSARFEDMAIKVANKLWSGLKQSKTIEMQSFHFLHMLRVSRNLREGATRDSFADKIFGEAIDAKKINVHVLNEMMQVSSQDQLSRLLGKSDFSTDPLKVIHEVPKEWLALDDERGKSPYEW